TPRSAWRSRRSSAPGGTAGTGCSSPGRPRTCPPGTGGSRPRRGRTGPGCCSGCRAPPTGTCSPSGCRAPGRAARRGAGGWSRRGSRSRSRPRSPGEAGRCRLPGGGLDVAPVGVDDPGRLVQLVGHAVERRPVALPGLAEALRAGTGPRGADLGRLAVEGGHRGADLIGLPAELGRHVLHLRQVTAGQVAGHRVPPSSLRPRKETGPTVTPRSFRGTVHAESLYGNVA